MVLALTRLFQEAVGVELFLEQVVRFLALVNVFMIELRTYFFRVIKHLVCQVAIGGGYNHLENKVEDLRRDLTSLLKLVIIRWILTQLLLLN